MGLLRILLALCVVVTHAPSSLQRTFLGGNVAVQAFFIISGFYMAFVLDRKYNFHGATFIFYQQRYLRLAPMYWVAVLINLAAAGLHSFGTHHAAGVLRNWYTYGSHCSVSTWAILIGTQVSMLGLDGLMFCHLVGNPLHLTFTARWPLEEIPALGFLIVPPAWSLSMELLFYILAPFLVRRSTGGLFLIIISSLLLRATFYRYASYSGDPWTYRFFPFEIALFLAGSLAYRWLPKAERVVRTRPLLCVGATAIFFAQILLHGKIPFMGTWTDWAFLASTAIMVPILFAATQRSRLDRWTGELSYPLYLLHEVTLFSIFPILAKTTGVPHECVIIAAPVLVAIAAQIFLERKFDAFRLRLFQSKACDISPVSKNETPS